MTGIKQDLTESYTHQMEINRKDNPEVFEAINEYFGTEVPQEFPELIKSFVEEKITQPQLKGFEDTPLQEIIVLKNKLHNEVAKHQVAIHGLMAQIYRLQEGIDMERARERYGIRKERIQ